MRRASSDPEKYHGVSKFDRVTGAPLAAKKEDFSAFFGAGALRILRKRTTASVRSRQRCRRARV
ncbi:MAG: hypothetical protein ACLR4Z_07760 [Butyricicoccaceae bacterium]